MAAAIAMVGLVSLVPLARGDADGVVAVIWIALMVVGGIFNYVKKLADDAKRREAEAQRQRSFTPAAAAPRYETARPVDDDADAAGDDDESTAEDEAERLRSPAEASGDAAAPSAQESFEEYARRKRAEREAAARQQRDESQRTRAGLEERLRALRERAAERAAEAAAAAAAATAAAVAPVVIPIAPPMSAMDAAESLVATARGPAGGLRVAEVRRSTILPPEVAGRLNEAQRLFIGGEIFGRPRMWRPGPGGRVRRKPAPAKK